MKVAIVISEFNKQICDGLLAGCEERLKDSGVAELGYDVHWVPGAFELPFAIKKLHSVKKYSGYIALGCVIKGDTDHYSSVCQGVTYGLQKVSLEEAVPVMFGVLMCPNLAQAVERSGKGTMNKGVECADSLIKLLKNHTFS